MTELLAPAGTIRNMKYAFAYGADAVYAGQPRYSLRVRNNDFGHEQLAQGIEYAHALGKQFYVASNIAPHNAKIKTFMRDIEPVIQMKPDALIMSDPGLIMMVKEQFPDQVIHLSVQANVVNYAAVKFWYKNGVKRIILSRELSLDEIEEIRMQCPEMELEVFVHGALCIAYSGRCLLSGYMNKRDPNQGSCTNACRWEYKAHEAKENILGEFEPKDPKIWTPNDQKIITDSPASASTGFDVAPTLGEGKPTDEAFLLEEENRPGQFMPAFEDEHGTYIMNSKDLRAIQHVERLMKMGIHSLKIEGRTKSHYYVARTTQSYRQAIDDAKAGKEFDRSLMDNLENLANRGFTEGFYRRHVHDEYQNYETGSSKITKQQFVAQVTSTKDGRMELHAKNKFLKGDCLELMTPKGNVEFKLDDIKLSKNQTDIDEVPGSDYKVNIPIPDGVEEQDLEKSLLMRYL